MKRLIALTLASSSLLLNPSSAKAEWDHWGYKSLQTAGEVSYVEVYTIDSTDGSSTLRSTKTIGYRKGIGNFSDTGSYVDGNKIYIEVNDDNAYYVYDLDNDSWSTISNSNWKDNFTQTQEKKLVKINADGSIQIGKDENDVDITAEGLSIDGEPLISKKANGELHIGKNSWITKEENGRQKVWAKDASGNSIPIDYTNGTKLLINGRDVEQSINNVGALSAALTGLPTVPTDTTLACGLGTGTHGGDFAFSGGCASKVNEKLSINYAASMTMPGQDYAGDFEDTFSARAGFVWKLGKSVNPSLISMKAKEKMEVKINALEENNKKIISQNTDLKQKNQSIISQNKALLARLERLEKIALGESKSKDLATIKLP